MMLNSSRKRALFLFGLATVAMLLLAVGISQVPFDPPRPFNLDFSSGETGGQWPVRLISLTGIFYLFIALYLLALASIFLTREGRIRLIAFIVLLSTVYFCVYTLGQLFKDDDAPRPMPTIISEGTMEPEFVVTQEVLPTVEEVDLSTPAWLITGVGIGLAAAVAAAFAAMLWLIIRSRSAISLSGAISEEAQAAVNELEAGGEFADVVIRCYAQMSRVLQEQRGLARDSAMTPREFEQVLIRIGFPPEPVHSLTRLFEDVRYGSILPGESGVERALSSLRAIVAHCEALG